MMKKILKFVASVGLSTTVALGEVFRDLKDFGDRSWTPVDFSKSWETIELQTIDLQTKPEKSWELIDPLEPLLNFCEKEFGYRSFHIIIHKVTLTKTEQIRSLGSVLWNLTRLLNVREVKLQQLIWEDEAFCGREGEEIERFKARFEEGFAWEKDQKDKLFIKHIHFSRFCLLSRENVGTFFRLWKNVNGLCRVDGYAYTNEEEFRNKEEMAPKFCFEFFDANSPQERSEPEE